MLVPLVLRRQTDADPIRLTRKMSQVRQTPDSLPIGARLPVCSGLTAPGSGGERSSKEGWDDPVWSGDHGRRSASGAGSGSGNQPDRPGNSSTRSAGSGSRRRPIRPPTAEGLAGVVRREGGAHLTAQPEASHGGILAGRIPKRRRRRRAGKPACLHRGLTERIHRSWPAARYLPGRGHGSRFRRDRTQNPATPDA